MFSSVRFTNGIFFRIFFRLKPSLFKRVFLQSSKYERTLERYQEYSTKGNKKRFKNKKQNKKTKDIKNNTTEAQKQTPKNISPPVPLSARYKNTETKKKTKNKLIL